MINADGDDKHESRHVGALLRSDSRCFKMDWFGGTSENDLLKNIKESLELAGFTDINFSEREQIHLLDIFPEAHQTVPDVS